MSFNWVKKGVIFNTAGQHDWMVSHACTPTAFRLNEEVVRILFSPRNERGQSQLAYLDITVEELKTGEFEMPTGSQLSRKPLLPLGELGTFDDGGIMPCSVVRHDQKIYLYYVGWNPSGSVPYRNAIGLAISEDNGETFHRPFPGALVDRNRQEPFFTASPFVMKEGQKWHMWYASGNGFVNIDGRIEPTYIIKYASSSDGIDWRRDNHTCIHPKDKFEANARATVIKHDGLYKMWYCHRGSHDFRDGQDAYRIGYAESENAVDWERMDDQAGIQYSESGWDSSMQTYPNILELEDRYLLFYNGNGFGRTGLGYAEALK